MKKEQLSVFDIFKIGIGPSSSHTLGPWRAAQRFINGIVDSNLLNKVVQVKVLLYGSLAKTGLGHGTDIAIQLGLAGFDPVTIDVNNLGPVIMVIITDKELSLAGQKTISFSPLEDVLFLSNES